MPVIEPRFHSRWAFSLVTSLTELTRLRLVNVCISHATDAFYKLFNYVGTLVPVFN